MSDRPPKVLISYSHNSIEHADRVLGLADWLRERGIDADIDQYEVSPPEGWPRWMDRQIENSDFVLLICTETYYRRVMDTEAPGKGLGVRWEGNLIYQHIYDGSASNTKFIPVLFDGADVTHIPRPVRGAVFYVLAAEQGYEDLYRRLTGQHRTTKPQLGTVQQLETRRRQWRESPEQASIVTNENTQVEDRRTVIVQAEGDGIRVTLGQPRLALSRLQSRRRPIGTDLDMLNPLNQAVPLIGREEEMEALKRWLASPRTLAARCLIGRAGSGKTRLGLELCAIAEGFGWHAGFVKSTEITRFCAQENVSEWGWVSPTLIVIDNAFLSARILRKFLIELVSNPAGDGNPLRLLLLARNADKNRGWWPDLVRPRGWTDDGLIDLFDPGEPCQLPDLLSGEIRREILTAVMSMASERKGRAERLRPPRRGENTEFDRALDGVALESEPLYLLMAGMAAVDLGLPSLLTLSRRDMAEQLAVNEIGRLRGLAEDRGLDDNFLVHMAAVVTLMRGCSSEILDDVVAAERLALRGSHPDASSDVAQALLNSLPDGASEAVSPILPYLIGEAAAIAALSAHSASRQAAVIVRAWRRAPRDTLTSVLRTAQDFATSDDHPALAWFDRIVEEAARSGGSEELVAICTQLPERTVNLMQRAAAVQSRTVGALRAQIERQPDDEARMLLAGCLTQLGERLGNIGRFEDALQAAEEAVMLRRDLAQRGAVDSLNADLALGLDTLASRLNDVGRREEALAVAMEAASMLRSLAGAQPHVFGRGFASSLADLAVYLSNMGRVDEALGAAEEAVALHRSLAVAEAEANRPYLALSLSNLAFYLGDAGRYDEAARVAEESTVMLREFAAVHPDAFRPGLAHSLHALAVHLGRLGRTADALSAAREAVGLQRVLAAARADAYRFDLALMLNTLAGRLHQLGQKQEACAAVTEAVAILREDANKTAMRQLPYLANSLNNVAFTLLSCNKSELALAATTEAVAIQRQLVASLPDRFRQNLAASLMTLCAVCHVAGQRERAVEASGEAVTIRRQLAERRPEVFREPLARSLTALAAELADLGQNEEAAAAAEEAASSYDRLAALPGPEPQPATLRAVAALADLLEKTGRLERALVFDERLLALLAAALPQPAEALAGLAVEVVGSYERRCAQSGRSPDRALLAEVARVLPADGQRPAGSNSVMANAQTSTLAVRSVAAVVDFLSEAGAPAATTGDPGDGSAVLALLRTHMASGEQLASLADLEREPADPDNQADLRKKLKHALAANATLRDEIAITLANTSQPVVRTVAMERAGPGAM